MDINNIPIRKNPSFWVNDKMSKMSISQGKLAKLSCLSEAKVSRMRRNSNDRGGTYKMTVFDVMAISIGLSLNKEEAKDFFFSAFPELELLDYFLEKKLSVEKANDILYDLGFDLLGNTNE
jgi:hypothetical protein